MIDFEGRKMMKLASKGVMATSLLLFAIAFFADKMGLLGLVAVALLAMVLVSEKP